MKCIHPNCSEPVAGPKEMPVLCRAHFIEAMKLLVELRGNSECSLCGSHQSVEVYHLTLTANQHTKIDGEGDFPICAECFKKISADPRGYKVVGDA